MKKPKIPKSPIKPEQFYSISEMEIDQSEGKSIQEVLDRCIVKYTKSYCNGYTLIKNEGSWKLDYFYAVEVDDYNSHTTINFTFKGGKLTFENKKYNIQLKEYEKKLNVYNKQLEQYKIDLEKYNNWIQPIVLKRKVKEKEQISKQIESLQKKLQKL